jgi:SMP-30/Gluconolactonase/LRE-like region
MARVLGTARFKKIRVLSGIASVKEAGATKRANVKMKRLASKRLSGAFILTHLCTAKYKARGIYKTTVLKPSGHQAEGLGDPYAFETKLASLLRDPLSVRPADKCDDQPCSSELHDDVSGQHVFDYPHVRGERYAVHVGSARGHRLYLVRVGRKPGKYQHLPERPKVRHHSRSWGDPGWGDQRRCHRSLRRAAIQHQPRRQRLCGPIQPEYQDTGSEWSASSATTERRADVITGIADTGTLVYVSDHPDNLVRCYTTAGVWQSDWALTDPGAIAVDGSGNIWVAQMKEGMIQEFSPSGNMLNTISMGSSARPSAMYYDSANNQLMLPTYPPPPEPLKTS